MVTRWREERSSLHSKEGCCDAKERSDPTSQTTFNPSENVKIMLTKCYHIVNMGCELSWHIHSAIHSAVLSHHRLSSDGLSQSPFENPVAYLVVHSSGNQRAGAKSIPPSTWAGIRLRVAFAIFGHKYQSWCISSVSIISAFLMIGLAYFYIYRFPLMISALLTTVFVIAVCRIETYYRDQVTT